VPDLNGLCRDFFGGIAQYQLLHAEGGEERVKNKQSQDAFFEECCLKPLLAEVEIVRMDLSQRPDITKAPTWWGDFLYHTLLRKSHSESPIAVLLSKIPLKDIYFLHEGKPTSLLEWACIIWALELVRFSGSTSIPEDLKDYPLQPLFKGSNPKIFFHYCSLPDLKTPTDTQYWPFQHCSPHALVNKILTKKQF